MTFSVHGLAVSRGIAIGRAVLVASSRADVSHYFIDAATQEAEVARVRDSRNAVTEEILRLQHDLPKDAPHEISALLDVHLMLLQDDMLICGVKHWITERNYNAEWALTTQYELIARQFDEMEDPYLRERKADLEQVVERILCHMKGAASPLQSARQGAVRAGSSRKESQQDLLLDDTLDVPLVLVAHDISPADMLQFKQSLFAGFATDVGGRTSHTAIVARSMDIPAVVGARSASQLIKQDDWVIIDGDAGVLIVDPSPIILAEYGFKQRQGELERQRLNRLRHTPALTMDGQRIELLANIEMPDDTLG
ncbi:MAG: phosphoenolpyruvate-utilizing N-terminal domain-containing protein, partial [Polaromonas sp.]